MSEFNEPKDVNGFIEVVGTGETYWIGRVEFKEMQLKIAKDYVDSLGNRDTAARTLNAFASEQGITDAGAQKELIEAVFPTIIGWFEHCKQQPATMQRVWFGMAYREFEFELHAEGRRNA